MAAANNIASCRVSVAERAIPLLNKAFKKSHHYIDIMDDSVFGSIQYILEISGRFFAVWEIEELYSRVIQPLQNTGILSDDHENERFPVFRLTVTTTNNLAEAAENPKIRLKTTTDF